MQTQEQRINYYIQCLANPRLGKADRAERRLIALGSTAVEQLIEAARSRSKEVRLHAAWALGQIGDPRGFEAILGQTRDPDSFVQYEAGYALGYLGDERAVGPLIELMSGEGTGDAGAADGAAYGLALLGRVAVEPLLDVLECAYTDAKQSAAWVLSRIGGEAVVEPIARLLRSSEAGERLAAVECLTIMGEDRPDILGQRCLELVAQCVDDPNDGVRDSATFGTEAIGKARTCPRHLRRKPLRRTRSRPF